MITALASLGKTHTIQIVADYDKDGNVVVTIILTPKNKKDDTFAITPLQFSGTVEEVDASIAAELPTAVTKLVTHGNNLADLDKQLAEAEAAKKTKVEKKKAEPAAKPPAKPATKPTSARPRRRLPAQDDRHPPYP